ncbi:DUF2218 domain-containing protein [Actinoplanes sp. NPDC023936]|uniref:DUF2218 domain-containing protein n=1 Tax=Actinoplanes sp. NPDC023936 TaxID=3154910 RepID=UPI0033CBAACE
MTTQHTATASVATTAAPRYAKQLASHLGRRSEIRYLGHSENEHASQTGHASENEHAGQTGHASENEHAGQTGNENDNSDIAIVLTVGECRLHSTPESLELTATANSEDDLHTVTRVIGSHLERFGQRNELTVDWKR